MYKGQKHCAGCGISGKDKPRESADGLCNECQRYLEIGRGMKPDETGFTYLRMNPSWADSISVTNNKTKKHIERTDSPVSVLNEGRSIKDEKLMNAFYKFLRTISVGKKEQYDYDMTMMRCGYYDSDIFVLRSDIALAFIEFYNEFAKYSHTIYDKGVKDGSNLLMKLHTGKITMEEFNKSI